MKNQPLLQSYVVSLLDEHIDKKEILLRLNVNFGIYIAFGIGKCTCYNFFLYDLYKSVTERIN